MLASKGMAKPTEPRGAKAAHRAIRGPAGGVIYLDDGQSEIFAAMLAEMDSRIDEIATRTEKLLAQHT